MQSNFGNPGMPSSAQVVTQAPINMVQVAPEAPHPASNNRKVFIVVGALQIAIGALSIILGAVVLSLYHGIYYPAYGIWSGIWFIICGSLAVSTGKNANSCNVIAGLVISILTCLTAFGVGIAESVLAAAWSCFGIIGCYGSPVFVGLHGTLGFLAFSEFIIAIVHSAYCCSGTCGGSNRQGAVLTTTTTYVNAPAMQPQFATQQAYAHPQYYPQPTAMQTQPAQMTGYAAHEQLSPPPVYENVKEAV